MPHIDITGKIGPLYPRTEPPEWPMLSYDRPAYMLWNSIAQELANRGWSETRIKKWLQSKVTRWALDDELGTLIIAVGKSYAKTIQE
jgi:hypothetical protein